MAKRRSRPKPKPGPSLGQLFSGEIIGSLLVVLALLILLSLLSSNRGGVTTGLIGALRMVFGAGTWALPVLLGVVGAWLAFSQVVGPEVLSARRLMGVLGLFLALEVAAHLIAEGADPQALALAGKGGGMVGWLTSQALVLSLGEPAAIVLIAVIAVVSAIAVSGLTAEQLRAGLARLWQLPASAVAAASSQPAPGGLAFPLYPTIPFYRRWWARLDRWQPFGSRSSNAGAPAPLPPAPKAGSEPSRQPETLIVRNSGAGRNSGASPNSPRPAAQDPSPPVRIVGGRPSGLTWRLPAIAEVLEDSTELDIQGEDLRQRAQVIESTLEGFGVPVQVVEANQGPAVTQFGLRPGIIVRRDRKGQEKRVKVRVSQIQALSNDLSLALAASPIRIEAPVPGRDIVGVEVPNVQISLVALRGVMESEEFLSTKGTLTIGLGRDVSGQAAVADLVRMPHLLIAGATGSGKSVCVNAIITALLLTHTPESLRFLMIDPKRVELTVYNGIPHLLAPVVVDVERAIPVLQWATAEMERRYKLFAKMSARNIESYNEKLLAGGEQALPYIVILIDELADLMLSAPEDVERYICRIAQMARATGMHLVIATQRPSVDVVTGLIKANFPARIAFAVTSQIDSRVILDTPGAEQLLGRGDMLFMAPDASKLQRLQGCYVSDRETQSLVRAWQGMRAITPEQTEQAAISESEPSSTGEPALDDQGDDVDAEVLLQPPWLPGQETLQQPLWQEMAEREEMAASRDDMYAQAVEEVRKSGRASVSLLQRRLRIGYSRAARLIDELESNGVIGPDLGGSRGREVFSAGSEPQEDPASGGW